MNRYNFISVKNVTPTAKEIASAKKVENLADILKASRSIGEYTFIPDEELTKIFKKAKAAEITLETLPNGANVNRCKINVDGSNYRLRVYGEKEAIPAQKLTAAQIAKVVFGFCTSDGEKVSENRVDGSTGEILSVPVMYANITAL